ncbi:MAG: T9SS type A sorting domain-containing protein [Bacteroidales bacterium]|nr:T9SS type A sorting domain-containing protein [Bacteroidales bacterium]
MISGYRAVAGIYILNMFTKYLLVFRQTLTATTIRSNCVHLSLCFLFVLLTAEAYEQTPLKPFPQHENYTAGAIKPANYNQSQLDDAVKAFYDQWKMVYLKNNCGANKYYVWFDEESSNSSICVSEGQGYGMMITAYMAGYDQNAKIYFDGLYNFYKAHPSANNSYLMAWNQVSGCVNDPEGGDNSATDGDMDIAFALLLADKQWGSNGDINYLEEALAMINAIKQNDVNQALWIPILGDWVTPGSAEYNDTRPSDFMMDHFRAFHNATGDAAWNDILNNCYALISSIQTNFSSAAGLLPDFIVDVNSSPVPAAPYYLEGEFDGDYYYNACRTPLRITTDYLVSGDVRGKNAVQKMNAWIRTKTGNDPTHIYAGYHLNGGDIPGNDYEAAAFIGPFAVAAMTDASHQNWLNGAYDFLLSLELQDYEYYDNTLKLLCMLVLSGNYWAPQGVPGSINDMNPENFLVDVFPNPFNSSSTVSIPNSDGKSVTLRINDAFGQTTFCTKENVEGKAFSKTMDLNHLSSGIYFLEAEIAGKKVAVKIFKAY